MDEPLSDLDAKLRVQTRTQIAQLQRPLEVTTVYVTHDQVEAMTMCTLPKVDGGVSFGDAVYPVARDALGRGAGVPS